MKILVTAGGTGGHIYPALAIIEEFEHQEENLDILYVGTHNRMEKDIIPKHNIKYVPIEIYGLTKNIAHDLKDIWLIKKAKKKLSKLIDEFKPDFILAAGGYVTYPVIKAAKKKKIKIFIHEQNAIPGKVNKLAGIDAVKVFVSFKETLKYFKNGVLTGNPTGEGALKKSPITKSMLGFDPNKKLVVIVMGSLGSMTINKKVLEYLKTVSEKEYQVLYISGKNYYEDNYHFSNNVKVLPYLDNLSGLLKNTDLLITRAGASTLAEVIALKVVSIFVPSPYVANNHQYYNAISLVNNNCGKMLEEKDFNVKNLNDLIDNTLSNEQEYQNIKKNLAKMETLNSAQIIYKEIKESLDNV